MNQDKSISNIYVKYNGYNISFNILKFPGGEIHVAIVDLFSMIRYRTSNNLIVNTISIYASLTNSDEIMTLLLVKNTIDNMLVKEGLSKNTIINLTIGYLAYARQDRIANPGEALSIKVMADLINNCNFNSVTLNDPHSDVSTALINNVIVRDLNWIFYYSELTGKLPKFTNENNSWAFVAPDAGATKKVSNLAKNYNIPVIQAFKNRDTKTGKITGTSLADYSHIPDIKNTNLLVVDDICDGGRTFIELAKVLKPITDKPLSLYITHGIFSHPDGPNVFKGLYDSVYCYNPFSPEINNSTNFPILIS